MVQQQISYQAIINDQMVLPSILFKNYHLLGLNETEVMVILQIHRFQNEGNSFPTPSDLAGFLSITEDECSQVLRKLIQKNILAIEQYKNDHNILDEKYSLESLWNQLYNPKKQKQPSKEQDSSNIFILFEQEFGRPLSPFEIETINIWIDEDEQQPSLIKAALREAVLMGKLNFRYIDRILREWKRKGIRSVEQARNHSKSFHGNQATSKVSQTESQPKRDVSLYYNWLEEE
ncbi:DnaD domain-containing protein [Aquibacillus sediminis]|uniref:DnaD domain-containing protein n=1 Tax=Aquibacillus sediminis TaxID=2574734 RepID=UPI0011088CB1|nr:DnaD domain-containing protein [Aquibacillus sediminis]